MSDIHRLLDEAFHGVTMTPELRDLKEELRGNLTARAAELQTKGVDAATASSTAVAELDLPELIAGFGADAAPTASSPGGAAAELARLHRVKPKPAFVIAATILSVALALATVAVIIEALVPRASAVSAVGPIEVAVVGIVLAALVDLSLRQETAQRFRMPNPRAIGYGLAAGALGAGIALGGLFLGHLANIGWLVGAVVLILAGVVALVALGVTQTNRLKPWALAQQRGSEAEDRFSRDPAAASRFGLYTVVIWTLAIAAFVVLSITVGFVWSWLALIGGIAVFFLVLSRMLFADQKK
jgi:MFS family permease